MIFTDAWRDVIIYGSENIIRFLAGAISATSKFPTIRKTERKYHIMYSNLNASVRTGSNVYIKIENLCLKFF